MKNTILIACVVGLSASGGLAAAQQAPATKAPAQEVKLEIAAQPVEYALAAFAEQSGTQIVFYTDLAAGLRAPRLSGTFTPQAALDRLLEGSGLEYEFVNGGRVVTIRSAKGAHPKPSAAAAQNTELHMARADSPRADSAAAAQSPEQKGATDSARESSGVKLEEIVVTATKRAQDIQDVPMSIAVLDGQDLDRRGVVGMEDYLRSIPGVNQIDRGGQDNAIIIRGISTQPYSESYSALTTVSRYFDETPISGLGAGTVDLRPVDLERIEVLRGPQGTTFGSASIGGTLRMIPAKPKLDAFGGKVAASYSDTSGLGGGNSMLQGVVNIPIVEDKFALRAVGYRYEDSGFYRSVGGTDPALLGIFDFYGIGASARGYRKDDIGRMRTSGGRLAAAWKPAEKLDISMTYLTQTIEQDGNPFAEVGPFDQAHAPIAPAGRVRGQSQGVADMKIHLANLVLDYDLGWATLTSVGSWIDGSSATAVDISLGLGIPGSTTYPSSSSSVTGEIRLASQLPGRLQFLGGVFYEDIDDETYQTLDWPGGPGTNPFGTDPMAVFGLERALTQRAVFGEVSYALTDKLTATVGGRYFRYDKESRNLTEGGLVTFPVVPIGGGVAQVLKSDEGQSNFKASLSYKPGEDTLLYGLWSQGFRLGYPSAGVSAVCDGDGDGLIDGTNTSVASTRQVDSDFLDNYEIGGKFALFGRRMVVDTAVYHIEWDGLPTGAGAPGCPVGFTANVGAATSDGVEFQASLFVVEGLRVDFGGGYTKAELSKDAPGLPGSPRSGSRLPGAPRVSANLAAQYEFNVAGHKAFVRADSFYTGKFYGNLLQAPITVAGDYIMLDARTGVQFKQLSVELFVRNLTDEDAYTWRGPTPSPSFFGYRLRPRTIGLQLGYSFQ